MFQGPEPAPIQETLVPLATQILCSEPAGERNQDVRPWERAGHGRVPEAGGEAGETDRLHSQASAAAGMSQGELPDTLTLVGQRQRAVEVALLGHPRGVVGLAGDPAGARAAHPDSCKNQGGVSPSQRLPGPLPACRGASSRAGSTQVACGLSRDISCPLHIPGCSPRTRVVRQRDSCPAVQKRRAPTVTQRKAG